MDSEILEEIESTYASFENLNKILSEIKKEGYINYWASQFCKTEYFENFDLAQSMFEYSLSQAQTWRDYKELAFAVGNSHGYDDKTWARELLNIAITKITVLRDLRILADAVCEKNDAFYDRGMSSELYKEVIEKSKNAYDFYCVAESLCASDLLDDKDWAAQVYEMAIEKAESADELTYIADSIAYENNLDDEQWAEELYKIAEEFQGQETQE
jgi:hypothetical protein